jgi:Mor family transcriptional regulator
LTPERRAAIATRNQAMLEARNNGERVIEIARRFDLTPTWTKKIIRA